jgi:hypothetical protein
MGGPGSGCRDHWWRPKRKTTAEECLAISASCWTRAGILRTGTLQSGRWVWTDPSTGEESSSVGFLVNTVDGTEPWAWLTYTAEVSGERLDYRLGLVVTTPHLGGRRWWFTCPMPGDGSQCGRRVGKLYLPPGRQHFGCRHCHRLSYVSSQESRKWDRVYRMLGSELGWEPDEVRRVLNRRHRGAVLDDLFQAPCRT